ncbi:MAG: sugar transferase [Longimicrobiales bacterium]
MEGTAGAIRNRLLASRPAVAPLDQTDPSGPRTPVSDPVNGALEAARPEPGLWPRVDAAVLPADTPSREFGRRALNVAVALIGIVVAAPVMLLIAIAIPLTSPGPVIFKQRRVGIDRRSDPEGHQDDRRSEDCGGLVFTMYKFRTMYSRDSDSQVWARPQDPRITPLGRFLRAYRLDELPQLFNVLLGDMNVVGPRPEQPRIFTRLADQFGAYRLRQRVLPGITGMAQTQLPYDQNLDDVRRKVDKDLEYIETRSLWTDLKIMVVTMKVLFLKRGSL